MKKKTCELMTNYVESAGNNAVCFSRYANFSFVQDMIISGCGPIGASGYLLIWDKDVLERRNDDYMVQNAFLFGTDGGDIAFGITKAGLFFEVPFMDMSNDAIRIISDTFDGFIEKIADGDY